MFSPLDVTNSWHWSDTVSIINVRMFTGQVHESPLVNAAPFNTFSVLPKPKNGEEGT
jgi:hypothetical protein